MMEKLLEAKNYIENITTNKPKIGIILGSGLGEFGESLQNPTFINYSDIPNIAKSTVEGHKGRFIITENIICMQGRFHFYEGYSMESVVFPVRLMKLLGVETLIVTNAAGGCNKAFNAGDLMVITDHINFIGTNPLIGKNLDLLGTRFPDMSNAYNKELAEIALSSAKTLGINIQKGIYCAMSGPSYETPAEIRMISILGGDAVGMSTVPEVICANHCGMKVLGISCITNMAAGVSLTPLCHEEVIETSEKVKDQFITLMKEIVKNI